MTATNDFLIEIGTEELPPLALQRLSTAFAENFASALHDQLAISVETSQIINYATPRRLALLVKQLPEKQDDQRIEKSGPSITHAFDGDGQPTKAAEGFARSCGVGVADLQTVTTDKGENLYYVTTQPGVLVKEHLLAVVETALAQLPIPKRMRWGAGDTEFVRPVHWVLALLGNEVLNGQVLGIPTSQKSFGHRFHAPAAISITHASRYAEQLKEQAYVIADIEQRKALIHQQVQQQAQQINGVVDFSADAELLDEVTALVEWPVAFYASFGEEFLQVPAEAVVMSMKVNQKYFPVFSANGVLTPYFIGVSNIDSHDMSQICEGNKRVIRPRLADAQFFWEQDKKQPLETFNAMLKNVVYQRSLGSIYDKTQRLTGLSAWLAVQINADVTTVERAACLSKADLNTEMVGEFPKLQGVMGRYYALASGEAEAVAVAIDEHYMPRYSGDTLPQSAAGQALALADRLDSLIGIFAAGEKPSGVKDPYGLRRAALAVLRIIIDKQLNLDLYQCLQQAALQYADDLQADKVVHEVFDYSMARLRAEYDMTNGGDFTPQQIEAVLATRPLQPLDFDRRLRAVAAFSRLPEAESLSAANKRIANLLKKADDVMIAETVDSEQLQDVAEQALYQALQQVQPQIAILMQNNDYEAVLNHLAGLRTSIDLFFDQVMVMVDDVVLRNNRLLLLKQLRQLFLGIADISKLPN